MNDNRPICLVGVGTFVGGAVLEIEPLRELEVKLNGGTLKGALEGVTDGDVDLGAVESAVTWVELPFTRVLTVESCAQLLERVLGEE